MFFVVIVTLEGMVAIADACIRNQIAIASGISGFLSSGASIACVFV